MKKTNLINKLANEDLIQSCFEELKSKRKESHHNNDIWHLAHHWSTEKPKIIEQLLTGTYQLQAVENIIYNRQTVW